MCKCYKLVNIVKLTTKMNKTCARCAKTVYPIEELKCLDKTWHKQCFKCQGCGMTLNMRTYKGFNKQPYCEAHIPKVKATAMAETPELKRMAENTKIQSNVKYHAEFEKAKGKFTQVADDPETLRIKQNTKIISNVAYHGEMEKKAIMEQKRTTTDDNEFTEQTDSTSAASTVNVNAAPPVVANTVQRSPGKIADYDPLTDTKSSPYSPRHAAATLIYTSNAGTVTNPSTRQIGSVADIDPVNDYYGSLTPATNNNYMPQQQPAPSTTNSLRLYRAMYDYEAQDSDEVSFCEGDLIMNCTAIDEGWMVGLVQRTGRHGMLPANYVEPAQI